MYIDQQQCTGCNACVPYCPVGAISVDDGTVTIDLDGCVECTTCVRFSNCPTGAIHESPETAQWPRILRREFSDPQTPSTSTGRHGRGTGGVKTNDVSGEIKRGQFGLTLEFGRPGVGTPLSEVEKVVMALARFGVGLLPNTPVALLLADPATGQLKPEVRDERVLTASLEIREKMDRLPEILPVVKREASLANTAISWGMTVRLEDDGSIPVLPLLRELGIEPRPNAKVNLGMGRPKVEE